MNLEKPKDQAWWARSSARSKFPLHLVAGHKFFWFWRSSGYYKSSFSQKCVMEQKWANSVVIDNATFIKKAYVGKILYGVCGL